MSKYVKMKMMKPLLKIFVWYGRFLVPTILMARGLLAVVQTLSKFSLDRDSGMNSLNREKRLPNVKRNTSRLMTWENVIFNNNDNNNNNNNNNNKRRSLEWCLVLWE